MFKKIAIVVVILLSGVLIYAATGPDSFRVERSIAIKAPPERIFAILSDFHQSPSWSPYEKKDPAMRRNFSGPANGKGSVYEFDGNGEVGSGSLTITDVAPPRKIVIALDMLKPFQAHNIVEYTLDTQGDATRMVWSIHGPMPYISKVMSLFFNMDQMIGKDIETGLSNLKSLLET